MVSLSEATLGVGQIPWAVVSLMRHTVKPEPDHKERESERGKDVGSSSSFKQVMIHFPGSKNSFETVRLEPFNPSQASLNNYTETFRDLNVFKTQIRRV